MCSCNTYRSVPLIIQINAEVTDAAAIDTSGCGSTKGCMSFTPSASTSSDCNALVTWALSEKLGYVDIELSAVSNGWVAVAFSHDEYMVT